MTALSGSLAVFFRISLTIPRRKCCHKLSSTKCDDFNSNTMVFGNRDGMETALETHARILDAHSKELKLLCLYQDQIALIRRVILEGFLGMQTMHNIRWQRSSVAHIHADRLSLDTYTTDGRVEAIVRKAAQLMEVWKTWADDKTRQYPFQDPLLQDMLCDLFEST